MHLNGTKLILCCAVSTLTACASSPPPAPLPPAQQPAELTVRCPPPVEQQDDSMDAAGVALKKMYDLYGICAGRLVDLVDRMNGVSDESAGH